MRTKYFKKIHEFKITWMELNDEEKRSKFVVDRVFLCSDVFEKKHGHRLDLRSTTELRRR